MSRTFHYTKGLHLSAIIAAGEILPARAYIGRGERPVVWFSLNPEWEATVWPGKAREELAVTLPLGICRIEVDEATAPYTWDRLRFLAKIHPAVADALEDSARKYGADPCEWRGTFWPVPREKWVAIETWVPGEGWLPNGTPTDKAA